MSFLREPRPLLKKENQNFRVNPFKTLINQTAVYGLSSILGRLLNYLLVPLYTRCFTPDQYGIVTEMYAYVAFLAVFLTYGMETSFFRFYKKFDKPKEVYSTILISLIVSSSLFLLLVFLNLKEISIWVGYGENSEYITWFSLIVFLDAISSISFAKLRVQNRAIRFATIRLINIAVNILLNLYFVLYKGFGIEYIFISNLVASLTMLLLLFPEMIKTKWVFNYKLWRRIITYAFPLLFAGLAGMVNETIDRVLLKHLLENSETAMHEVGIYGAFYKLSIIMVLFTQTFRFAAEPFYFLQEKKKNYKKIYADIMKYFVITTGFIFLCVLVFYDFIKFFIGSEYHDERGFFVVAILLLANLFLGIYYNLSIWYKLTEKTIYGALISVFGATITIALNFILIPVVGFVGCAITTLVCYFLMTYMSYYFLKKHYPIPYDVKKILTYLASSITFFIIIYALNTTIYTNLVFLLSYICLVLLIEKPKKIVNSKPKSLTK